LQIVDPRGRAVMKKCSISAALSIALIAVSVMWIGCGSESTVHAQQTVTPAILTGYCDASGPTSVPATAFMIGFGASIGCHSMTGSNNTGLPMTSSGTLQNLRVLSFLNNTTVTVNVNGVASPITCTVTGTTAPFTCSDSTHKVQVSSTDLVAVVATVADSSIVQGVQVAIEKQ